MAKQPQARQPDPATSPLGVLEAEAQTLAKTGEAADLNDLVLGLSPAMAAASLYISNANSLSILYGNAVATQKQQTVLAQSALSAGIAQLQSLTKGVPASAVAAEDPDSQVRDLLTALMTAG